MGPNHVVIGVRTSVKPCSPVRAERELLWRQQRVSRGCAEWSSQPAVIECSSPGTIISRAASAGRRAAQYFEDGGEAPLQLLIDSPHLVRVLKPVCSETKTGQHDQEN